MTGRPETVASAQLRGAREQQEDALAVHVPVAETGARAGESLLVLADGMGGHVGGEVASRMVVDSFCTAYRDSRVPVADALRGSLDLANESLADFVAGDPVLQGMGATLLACVVRADGLYWISVGDSPLWLYRDATLQRLNADHSMVPLLQDMVRTGILDGEEARSDPRRNLLRSAVTGRMIALVDLHGTPLVLRAGDLLLLASDGVETLPEYRLAELLRQAHGEPPETLVVKLLAAVEAAGHPYQDNASVILYRH